MAAQRERAVVDGLLDDPRQRMLVGRIADRDRVVRRVDDEHVRLADPLPRRRARRDLAREPAALALRVRIAVALLVLALDFLLRHPVLANEHHACDLVIGRREHRDDDRHGAEQLHQHRPQHARELRRRFVHARDDERKQRGHHLPCHAREHERLDDHLHELEQRLQREDPLDARHRIDRVELRHHGLERDQEARLRRLRHDARDDRGGDERQHRQRGARGEIVQRGERRLRGALAAHEVERGANRAREAAREHRFARREHADRGRERHRVGDVLALGDLALLAYLLQLLLGGLFGFLFGHRRGSFGSRRCRVR
ncbi:hypothetical protein DP43_6625 [Burkholderia pseudomallei]|nr:hypothetical protein DP43_6625 [Burkholderia pseudomallei]